MIGLCYTPLSLAPRDAPRGVIPLRPFSTRSAAERTSVNHLKVNYLWEATVQGCLGQKETPPRWTLQ